MSFYEVIYETPGVGGGGELGGSGTTIQACGGEGRERA